MSCFPQRNQTSFSHSPKISSQIQPPIARSWSVRLLRQTRLWRDGWQPLHRSLRSLHCPYRWDLAISKRGRGGTEHQGISENKWWFYTPPFRILWGRSNVLQTSGRQFQSRQLYSKSVKLGSVFHHVSPSQITSSGYRGCPQQLRLCWRHRARCQCHGPVPTRGRGDVQSSLVEGRKGIV